MTNPDTVEWGSEYRTSQIFKPIWFRNVFYQNTKQKGTVVVSVISIDFRYDLTLNKTEIKGSEIYFAR